MASKSYSQVHCEARAKYLVVEILFSVDDTFPAVHGALCHPFTAFLEITLKYPADHFCNVCGKKRFITDLHHLIECIDTISSARHFLLVCRVITRHIQWCPKVLLITSWVWPVETRFDRTPVRWLIERLRVGSSAG